MSTATTTVPQQRPVTNTSQTNNKIKQSVQTTAVGALLKKKIQSGFVVVCAELISNFEEGEH